MYNAHCSIYNQLINSQYLNWSGMSIIDGKGHYSNNLVSSAITIKASSEYEEIYSKHDAVYNIKIYI